MYILPLAAVKDSDPLESEDPPHAERITHQLWNSTEVYRG
jgi:hypothetical protein